MERNNPILAMFASEPALVAHEKQDQFMACLNGLMACKHIDEMLAESAAAPDNFWPEPDSWRAQYRPYVVLDGVLHIPVKGVLLHNFPFAYGNYATGYEYVWRAFERGMKDAGVIGIAFIMNTPGGMVAGCGDAADKMFALKQEIGKPVRAFAHESAYSAGYWVATVADHIVVSRTGGVGSIGVVTSHVDWSKFNERVGLAYTFIFAGKHKVDGNPEQPLPADVKARIQARIDELYEVFVSTVARNRPQLSEDEVRATEALTFTATQAVSNKLADSIGSLDDALAAFAADLSSTSGDEEMSTKDEAADNQAVITAARAEGRAEGHAAGLAEGQTAAVARINAILGSDEGKARPKAALSAALKTAMSADEAKAFLGDLPEEKAEAAPAPAAAGTETPFDAAMEDGNPNVGANRGKKNDDEAVNDGSDVVALAAAYGLKGFNSPAAQQ